MIDAHCHLQLQQSAEDWIHRGTEQGVTRFICCGTSPDDWARVAELAKSYDSIVPAFGIHPWRAETQYIHIEGQNSPSLDLLRQLLDQTDYAAGFRPAVGEIGLDLAVSSFKSKQSVSLDQQKIVLNLQLQLAQERNLPVMIHAVQAMELILELLEYWGPFPLILFHGIMATKEQINKAVAKGAYFSFSPRVLFSRGKRMEQTLESVPLHRMLLESDGPVLLGGNEKNWFGPEDLPDVLNELAIRKKIPLECLTEQINTNEEMFFQQWPRIET